jgi:hypothetical protein
MAHGVGFRRKSALIKHVRGSRKQHTEYAKGVLIHRRIQPCVFKERITGGFGVCAWQNYELQPNDEQQADADDDTPQPSQPPQSPLPPPLLPMSPRSSLLP